MNEWNFYRRKPFAANCNRIAPADEEIVSNNTHSESASTHVWRLVQPADCMSLEPAELFGAFKILLNACLAIKIVKQGF